MSGSLTQVTRFSGVLLSLWLAVALGSPASNSCTLQRELDILRSIQILNSRPTVENRHSQDAVEYITGFAVQLMGSSRRWSGELSPRAREAFIAMMPGPRSLEGQRRRIPPDSIDAQRVVEGLQVVLRRAPSGSRLHRLRFFHTHPQLPGKVATTLSYQDVEFGVALRQYLLNSGTPVPVEIIAVPLALEAEGVVFSHSSEL